MNEWTRASNLDAHLAGLYAFNFADSIVLCLFLKQNQQIITLYRACSTYQSLCGEIVDSNIHSVWQSLRQHFSKYIYIHNFATY